MVGQVLADRYELEELVGAGGMSSVFRAHDRLLDRKVALKVLHQEYTDDDQYVERFRREARTAAALSHPNIVTVIDRGEHEGRQFIVFEYVDGDNLKQMIERRGPAPVDTALELAIQVARGLSFAHQAGLVHRDVKPQNVLLNGDGQQAKVTDFGIARSLDVQRGMTQTGTVLGTSDYIAPEQAQGQHVDEHTDVYSLGVVLYELLTTETPFSGENFVAVAMRHINEPAPSVLAKRGDVPPRVDAAIQRAMAKDPADRFPTMADFCRELEACLAEVRGGVYTAPVRVPRVRRTARRVNVPVLPIALLLVALAFAGAVIAYALIRNGGGSSAQTNLGGGGVPHVIGAGAYDPFGDGVEHAADAPKATDSDSSSFWSTSKYYYGNGSLGKKGVGLVLDARRPVTLHQLGIATDTPGFTAVIRAGATSTSFPHWISSPQQVGSQTQFDLHQTAPYRYFLIWITKLGQGYNQAHVNQVSAT